MSEEINWETDDMECGHTVDRAEFYIDCDNIVNMRYICHKGCKTPWLKLRKAPLPRNLKFDSDPFEDNYVLKPYVWNKIYIGNIITFKGENGKVEYYEVAYKLYRQHNLNGARKKIFYLRPVSTEEYVVAEFWEDGTIHFMPGIEKPFTTNGFQSWTEKELEEIEERVRHYIKNRKGVKNDHHS